jgi:DNA polymerase III alpha subunit
MASINQHSSNTIDGHQLWFDGSISVSKLDDLLKLIQGGVPVDKLFIDTVTPEVEQYNKFVSKSQQISSKDKSAELLKSWNLPKEYIQLDINEYIFEQFDKEMDENSFSEDEIEQRMQRLVKELCIFSRNDFNNVLKAIIYIINTLEENNVVWGVGRGSSVSSYLLYLIGTHDVDSVKYNLDVADFIS